MRTRTILSWNVNGLRAVLKKGFLDFLEENSPDILGIQETKLQEEQLPEEVREPFNYKTAWNYAGKKGYSGTGVFYKEEPQVIKTVFDEEVMNNEGRVIELKYPEFTLFNIYFPNGQMNEERLNFKLDFYDKCLEYFNSLRNKGGKLIITGDINTAHKPIDLANPKSNEDRSGFLPIEREWIDKFISNGYIDTFRMFNKDPDNYTWWTYRMGARSRNVGWRIDYFFISDDLKDNIVDSYILPDVMGSDHCPIGIKIKI